MNQLIKRNIFISAGIIVLAIGIAFSLLRSNDARRPLPPLFRNPPENITGISTPIDNQWNLYRNEVLGFELAYPAREFQYGQLKPTEEQNSWPIYPWKDLRSGGSFFQTSFSDGDSASIMIIIEPSYASTLQEWLQHYPEFYQSDVYKLAWTSLGNYEALIIRNIMPSTPPEFREGETAQGRLLVIRNSVLFTLDINFLKSEEQQRIFQSFQFLP